MKSVMQESRECYICGKTGGIHEHHIFGGPSRKWSEKYGLKVYLCPEHHNMSDRGVHFDRELDISFKRKAQRYFEAHYGSRDEFRSIFIRSYM